MKLIDILARELKVWPCKLLDFAQQDHDKEIRFHSFGEHSDYSHDFYVEDRAEDGCDEVTCAGGGVKVTRAQWQAAVDALKAAWTCEGLPPVGTVCEFYADEDTWRECKIVGENEGYLIVWVSHAHIWTTKAAALLRPVRTPEQIAAEERELAITDICLVMDKDPNRPVLREKAGILYDAGYRKQVAP